MSKKTPEFITAKPLPGESDETIMAHTMLQPPVNAAATLRVYGQSAAPISLAALVRALEVQVEASRDNLQLPEEMALTQALTLDAMFNQLAQRAANAQSMDKRERYLKLALRAQAQGRATLQAISAMRQPAAVAFVRQANIANGPQQVNNGVGQQTAESVAEENRIGQNELLEQIDGQRLDTGATGSAGGADQELEAVGKIYRSKDDDGQA